MPRDTYDAYEPEIDALHVALAHLCHGRDAQVVVSALTTVLADVITMVARDLDGVDEFATLFHRELRNQWLREQPSKEVG